MKSRKVLHHQELIEEVKRAVKQPFKPSFEETEDSPTKEEDIEKRIKDLIDNGFLERDSEDNKKYRFIEILNDQALGFSNKNLCRQWR
ncbi:hypothetical protein Sjap_007541 [Stephania japonica]|uniref:Cullin neddylation domain-containing protein n=1 Tax=Stephania japonica TaxID=461633 RepID=A0AAP0JMX3_9MAGN